MAKRVAPYSCSSCIHLQKEDPIISGQMALYRCTSQRRNGRCVGWVEAEHPDKGLNTMGGSCFNKLYPGDVFDVFSRFEHVKKKRYMYCGKKKGQRILLSIPDHVYTPVQDDYFRGQIGKLKKTIKMVMQSEEQKCFHRKLAKNIMRKHYHE